MAGPQVDDCVLIAVKWGEANKWIQLNPAIMDPAVTEIRL